MTDVGSTSPISYSELQTEWPEKRYFGLTAVVWMRILIIGGLMCALFWPNLRRLWLKTNFFSGESNWLHSPFVPALGLYYLYMNRDAIFNAHRQPDWGLPGKAVATWFQLQIMLLGLLFYAYVYQPSLFAAGMMSKTVLLGVPLAIGGMILWLALWSTMGGAARARHRSRLVSSLRDGFSSLADRSSQWFGIYILLWGLLFYAWGIWPGQNDFFKDLAMVIVLFGGTLMVTGWRIMRVAWFPILFLICAIPWPGLMYAKIAMPLQELAAYAACRVLSITGVEATKEGTKIFINMAGGQGRPLNVAEACAGLKSLMTFITVAAAVGFLSHRLLWQKLVIVASAVPIAILCNVFRVAGQGLLHTYATPKLSDGFAHQFVGMIMLIPAFFMILFVGWLLDNLFVDEVDRRTIHSGPTRPTASKFGHVIEIPRGAPKTTTPKPAPSAPTDLAAATKRLMSTQGVRRGARSASSQPTLAGPETQSTSATSERKDNP